MQTVIGRTDYTFIFNRNCFHWCLNKSYRLQQKLFCWAVKTVNFREKRTPIPSSALLRGTKRRNRVVSTPSYSGGPRFRSRPTDRLS